MIFNGSELEPEPGHEPKPEAPLSTAAQMERFGVLVQIPPHLNAKPSKGQAHIKVSSGLLTARNGTVNPAIEVSVLTVAEGEDAKLDSYRLSGLSLPIHLPGGESSPKRGLSVDELARRHRNQFALVVGHAVLKGLELAH